MIECSGKCYVLVEIGSHFTGKQSGPWVPVILSSFSLLQKLFHRDRICCCIIYPFIAEKYTNYLVETEVWSPFIKTSKWTRGLGSTICAAKNRSLSFLFVASIINFQPHFFKHSLASNYLWLQKKNNGKMVFFHYLHRFLK